MAGTLSTLALEEVLIVPEHHMPDCQGLVRAAVQGHGIGLQVPPGKGDQDLSRRVKGVLIPVIGDAVRLNGNGPSEELRLESPDR